jgi:hypothetical protein
LRRISVSACRPADNINIRATPAIQRWGTICNLLRTVIATLTSLIANFMPSAVACLLQPLR